MPSSGSIFATYATRENRVTATLIAVLERIGLDLTDRILADATGEASFELVSFHNQPSKEGDGVPDAEIRAGFRWLFETKTSAGAIGSEASLTQLRRHLGRFDRGDIDERLFVLTPDKVSEAVRRELDRDPVTWITFKDLASAIENLITDEAEPSSEQQRFLLRELLRFFEEENLLDLKDVVVVAARNAYPEYLEASVYTCQAERPFREVEYLGFYTQKQIKSEVARIEQHFPSILVSEETAAEFEQQGNARMAHAIRWNLEHRPNNDGVVLDMRLLSPPEDPRTVVLDAPIEHTGKGAWVQGQRYASLEAMRTADTTENLES